MSLGTFSIDSGVVLTLLDGLDSATIELLLNAAETDMTESSEALIAAWQAGDSQGAARARHSLKGICGTFGATVLLGLSERDLADADSAAMLRHCCAETIKALRAHQ